MKIIFFDNLHSKYGDTKLLQTLVMFYIKGGIIS